MDIFSFLAEHFDLPILDWIAANVTCPFLDAVMPIITRMGDAGMVWIVLAVALLCLPKYRRTGLAMAMALLLGLLVCNLTLKPLAARIRPFDYQMLHYGREIALLIDKPHDFSFPSGHTIASFEAATVLLLRHKKWGVIAMILAATIAFSRLYLYVHYVTDVLFSFVLGIGFAILSVWLIRKLPPSKHLQ